MPAPGRLSILTGNAPDPAGVPPTVNPTRINLVSANQTAQSFSIRNAEVAGGADLTWGTDGTNFVTLNPREAFWESNVRVGSVLVRSGTNGSTAAYEIVVVEQ